MRHLLFALWAAAAAPALSPHTDGAVTVSAPEGWKVLIKASEHNAVVSRDGGTHVHVHWWPYKAGASADKMLDKLIRVTNDNLPLGAVKETRRVDVAGGRLAEGEFTTLGYTMRMGFVVTADEDAGLIRGAIFLTNPEGWTELGGADFLQAVTASLAVTPAP